MNAGPFLGVASGRDVTLTPHTLQVPRSENRVAPYLYSSYGLSWPVKRVKPTYLVKVTILEEKKVIDHKM
jgi:hypothetical protein